jgi:hypothetical protein
MIIELVVNPLITFYNLLAYLEEELEQFEGAFERDEIVDL